MSNRLNDLILERDKVLEEIELMSMGMYSIEVEEQEYGFYGDDYVELQNNTYFRIKKLEKELDRLDYEIEEEKSRMSQPSAKGWRFVIEELSNHGIHTVTEDDDYIFYKNGWSIRYNKLTTPLKELNNELVNKILDDYKNTN